MKTYTGVLTVDESEQDALWLQVHAEEMVECFVNDCFVDVSLWNPHQFRISDYVKQGENSITLKVTGSAANRFTGHRIAYGVIEDALKV